MLRLIAGSGRSGTTWVLDALAEANGLRPVFEPLHPDESKIGLEFAYSYMDRKSESTDLGNFFAAIADNKLRSAWTSYRIRSDRLRITGKHFRSLADLKKPVKKWQELIRQYRVQRNRERREGVLVKCIRANLMLDWIHAKFGARIVLLMRHPCAVVESQLRLAEHWDPYYLLQKYGNDAALVGGALGRNAIVLDSVLSRPQALTAIWCIENLVPAAQAAENGYQIVFYEELLERPDVEWPRIAHGLALTAVPGASLLAEPSQQAAVAWQRGIAADGNYSQNYGRWRERLTKKELQQIESMLEAFSVDFYKVTENRPNVPSFTQRFM